MKPAERRVLVVAILASFVVFLDGSVVNVALPAIAGDLDGGVLDGLALQQWVVDAYLVTLGALILVAGSLSDVLGRRRVLSWGLVGFGLASLACAVAPTGVVLVVARAVQGAAGALLVPSSLAMIVATFRGEAQGRAIGTWTAWTGTAMIAGPLLGGILVDTSSWRWVFAVNVLPVAVTAWLLRGTARGERDRSRRVDVAGAALVALGLAGTVFALIEQGRLGWDDPLVWGPLFLGVAALDVFVLWERRVPDPVLPLRLFAVRNFSAGNLTTAFVYGALAFGGFVVVLFLQQVAGYSATAAGLAMLPVTLLMLVLSSRAGSLAGRYGARVFMTAGPLLAAAGYLLMLTTTQDADYLTQLLPGVLLFGLGLSATVAPLTASILAAVPPEDAGIGSAVNNAVSRVAGLVVIACAGVVLGPTLDLAGFHRALVLTAVLLALGGLVSWLGVRDAPTTAGAEGSAVA
ncbi:MFS transporter [Sanguibacter inulinus]|uniref:MFS transporter n=1 Tax=Sanguibacter inulinus TaxID=60922 RepID=A0A853EUK1_9MICO|nr:MFS transporter [Sanguibacter inulinus]MBF0721433.1 MFS transporter [Sanguibacter inulinus]NYS92578.1 MFS transporter [Sanguibacter inulinus]